MGDKVWGGYHTVPAATTYVAVLARYQMPPRKRPKKGGEAAPAAPRTRLRSGARGGGATAAQDGGTRPATAEAVCSGGVPAIQQAYQAENEAEEARAKAVEAIRTAFVRGAGPAPDNVVQHKLGDRILPVQVEAARFFSIDNWEALKGTWPSNARTSTLIQGACARIKIKCDQLKRQWDNYAKEVAGKSERDETGRQRYENALLALIGDGTDIIDAAFAAAKAAPEVDVMPCCRAFMESELDNPKTRLLSFVLLNSWADAASLAWANSADAFYFERVRQQDLLPEFRDALAERDETSLVVVDFERLLFNAYSDAIRSPTAPSIEMPPADYEQKLSTGQREALYYIAGYIVYQVWMKFRKHEDVGEFVEEFFEKMDIGGDAARRDDLPVGQVMLMETSRLVYAHASFFGFVCRLERVVEFNLSQEKDDYYGSKLMAKVSDLVVQSSELFDELGAAVLPLLPHQTVFPRKVYDFIIEKFIRTRRKDFALCSNQALHERQRTDATAKSVPLRNSVAAVSAAAAAREKTAARGA